MVQSFLLSLGSCNSLAGDMFYRNIGSNSCLQALNIGLDSAIELMREVRNSRRIGMAFRIRPTPEECPASAYAAINGLAQEPESAS
jgi:hypothetical protein